MLAKVEGEAKAVNVVLMGILARFLSFSKAEWEQALQEAVPARALAINMSAFKAGYNLSIS